MNRSIREELWHELFSRGFSPDGKSPRDTMWLTDSYYTSADLVELLDVMVTRREKVFRSVNVVGREAATNSYEDVILVIDAIKAVIGKLGEEGKGGKIDRRREATGVENP